MRLINADEHECWACIHHITGKCDTWCDAGESFELREDVKDARTAFDVVKVIKQLEEEANFFGGESMGTLQKHFYCIGIQKAIDIIKEELNTGCVLRRVL